MANTQFNMQEAQNWERKAEELKQQADAILKKITQCLQDMQSASDNITAAIYQVGSQLAPKFEKLVQAVAKMIECFRSICKTLKEMAENAIDGIKAAAKNMVGGLNITATAE